jgi:uncharacterized metal-binding protein
MSKIMVVPCSGIGKVLGLMTREAALEVTNHLAPEQAETVCLAHVVSGDDAAVSKVKGVPCITIDGCPAKCASKSIENAGGIVKASFKSMDAMRNHKGKDAGTATSLTEDGWIIVDELAADVADTVNKVSEEES